MGNVRYEARCGDCGETFIPDGKDDLEHAQLEDGTFCGGKGEITFQTGCEGCEKSRPLSAAGYCWECELVACLDGHHEAVGLTAGRAQLVIAQCPTEMLHRYRHAFRPQKQSDRCKDCDNIRDMRIHIGPDGKPV